MEWTLIDYCITKQIPMIMIYKVLRNNYILSLAIFAVLNRKLADLALWTEVAGRICLTSNKSSDGMRVSTTPSFPR